MPAPGPGQLLLKVLACGINPLDAWFCSGHLAPRFPRALPYTPGPDIVGVVESGAAGTGGIAKGDRVMGVLPVLGDGGYAEFALADAERLVLLPAALDPVEAAAMMTPGITGLQLAREALSLGRGHVLVLGALGAVGRAAVAALLADGAEVTAVVRPGREQEARALGVQQVETGNDPDRIAALENRFDAVLDTAGPDAVKLWEKAILPNGLVLSVVPMPPAKFSREDARTTGFAYRPDPEILGEVAGLMASGRMSLPEIEAVGLAETVRAHASLLGGGAGKKFVLVPDR